MADSYPLAESNPSALGFAWSAVGAKDVFRTVPPTPRTCGPELIISLFFKALFLAVGKTKHGKIWKFLNEPPRIKWMRLGNWLRPSLPRPPGDTHRARTTHRKDGLRTSERA